MTFIFEKFKKEVLEKSDKSSKGFIDSRILDLCNVINDCEDMVTLSSCSGRISLLEVVERSNKRDSKWLCVTHDEGDDCEFWRVLEGYGGGRFVMFKQESAILHVCVEGFGFGTEADFFGEELWV